jgi:hypothetical protein
MNPNERDRIGSLIQLYSVGHQDTALTYRPEITLFHREYKQHMGFGTHHVNLPKESATNFLGKKDAFAIPRQGTYLSNMSLMILFRDTQVGNQLFMANNKYGVLELISDITFRVGNDVIDSVTPDQIVLEHSLFQGAGRWEKLSETLRGHENSNGEIEVLIPIPFWFCHWKPGFDNGSKFPLYPLSPGVPLEVSVTWKDKNLAKCICSSQLTRYIELWVDYITCPQIEVDYLQTDSQEDLIMTHSQATRDIREKDQKVDIPFRHICKQLCWGFKHEVDLVDYIQTMVETDKSVRERLSALETEEFKVSRASIIAALDGRISHQTLLFEKNLLCNVQNEGFLLHHFTLDKTLHDYIEEDYPRLLLAGHTSTETERFVKMVLCNEGDYFKESFLRDTVSDPSDALFRRVYGPYLQGVRCKDIFYTTAYRRTDKDLSIQFRIYPMLPMNFLQTWSEEYKHPICMVNTNASSFELRYDYSGRVFATALGRTFSTGLSFDTRLAWTDIEIVFKYATTLVYIQTAFNELPIVMPTDTNYWISFGNFVSIQRVRDETVKTLQALNKEVLSYISAATENYVCTEQGIYYKKEHVLSENLPRNGIFVFEDSVEQLTVFFRTTVLQIDHQGQQKYRSASRLQFPAEKAVIDSSKQWIFVKSGNEIVKFNASTLDSSNVRSDWADYIPSSFTPLDYNLVWYQSLYAISCDASSVYFGKAKFMAYTEPGSLKLSSVVTPGGIVYVSTGTRVIRYPNMFTEPPANSIEILDVSGIPGFVQVDSMFFYDSDLYLHVKCLTSMGVIRIVHGNSGMYIDTTFGERGLQSLLNGFTYQDVSEFKTVQKTLQYLKTNQYAYLALPKDYKEEVFSSLIVATTENYACTEESIYYKKEIVRTGTFPRDVTFAFEDVTGRLTLFFNKTMLCIDQQGEEKVSRLNFFTDDVEDAVEDDTKQWIFVKSGDTVTKFDAHTLKLDSSGAWIDYIPISFIPTGSAHNLVCFQETLYTITANNTFVYFGREREFTHGKEFLRLSSVVVDGIAYASTGTQIIRCSNMFTSESSNPETLDISGIYGFEQVHSMYFYDSYLYLYVECTAKVNPTGSDTTKQTTMGVIRIVIGDSEMYIDNTFGEHGLQPLFSGATCQGLPEFKLAVKTFLDPFLHHMVGKKSTWLDSSTNSLCTIDLDTQFKEVISLPVAPIAMTIAVDPSQEKVMFTTRSSVVTRFPDSTYDFDFYVVENETPVRIRCTHLTGLYHNNVHVYQRDSFITGGWKKLVYSHPLYNSHYAVLFTDASDHTYIRFCSVTVDASFNVTHTVPQFDGIDFSKLQFSLFQDKVIYTYNQTGLGTYTYMRLPMYVSQNFYKTDHLSVYTDGMNALATSDDHVIVFSKSMFFFDHYVHKATHIMIPHDNIYSLQWVNNNIIIAIVFYASRVSIKWLTIDSSLNVVSAVSTITTIFSTVPKVTVGKVTNTTVDLYINGTEYLCEKESSPTVTAMNDNYVYYRHTGPNRFILCKLDDQIVLRDLNKEYQDYPFYLTPTDEMPVYLHYDSSFVFVRIGFAVWKFSPVRPEAVLCEGIHRPFHVSRDILYAYSYYKQSEPDVGYGSRLELPPPKLRPVDENSIHASFFTKFQQEQFARRQVGYYLSDIRLSNETSRKRENLYELWSSIHNVWIFEVYTVNIVGISISPLELTNIVNIGDTNSLTFYDVFGNSLSEFTTSVTFSHNQIKVTFSKPVQVDGIRSTQVLEMERDLQIYVKHSFQDGDLYYFVVDTGLLGVPGQQSRYTFGIENMARIPADRSSIYIPSISLRDLDSMGIPVYNSLAYSPIPATYQLQLGEAILPSEPRSSEYFQTVVPFYTLQNSSSLRPNVYSFAVFPTYFQPSGHYNMSVTDNYLTIRLPNRVRGTLYFFGFMYNIIKHTTECKVLFR